MKLINQGCLFPTRASQVMKIILPLSFQGSIEVAVQLSHGGFATDTIFPGAVRLASERVPGLTSVTVATN